MQTIVHVYNHIEAQVLYHANEVHQLIISEEEMDHMCEAEQ